MARIATTVAPAPDAGVRTADIPVAHTIIGVELFKTIPSGYTITGTTITPHADTVTIRPTNVTATCGESVETADNFILIHNGPKGGFTQNYKGGAVGATGNVTLFFNSVVRAVITDL